MTTTEVLTPTELNTAPEADDVDAEAAADAVGVSDSADQDTDNGDHVAKLRRESAKYRTRAQDAESQLAEAQAEVARLQRQIVAGQLQGVSVAALEAAGADIAAMIDDNGAVNAEALSAAANEARSKFGISMFNGAGDGGHRNEVPVRSLDWASAIKQQLNAR